MKFSFVSSAGALCLAMGCSQATGPIPSETTERGEIGTIEQAAQLDFQHHFSLVGNNSATLYFTADNTPTDIEIRYFGDKNTLGGYFPMAPVSAATISLNAFETKYHSVNLFHPAFFGGYGSIQVRLDPNGQNGGTFQTYFSTGESLHSLGGQAFNGVAYRVPYAIGTTNVVMAVTNLETTPLTIEFRNLAPGLEFQSVVVQPFSTFRFDAGALNWNVSGTGSVDVFGINGSFALSGYTDRWNGARIRAYPVRLAPGLN